MWDGKQPIDEYLEHHGVKGMKWGVRKARPTSSGYSRTSKKVKKTASDVINRFKKPKVKSSFTEGGKRKADTVISEKDRKRRQKQLKGESKKREQDWQKLYLKRSQMGDRELQLALNRLKLENQLAKEVSTASVLTPKPKSFMEKHGSTIVVGSKVVGMIASNVDNPRAKQVAQLAKLSEQLVPKKKD